MKIRFTYILFITAFLTIACSNLISHEDKFDAIISKAEANNWKQLEYGDLIVTIGKEFLAVPYVGGTLETGGKEECTVVLEKLDCVTYFETSLALAYILKNKEIPSYEDLIERVEYTRYRDGKVSGYESRLHYTSEWILDNIKKKVVRDITKEIGEKKLKLNLELNFMSSHAHLYPALKDNPELTSKIAAIENEINKNDLYYIPRGAVKSKLDYFQNGDIVAFVTTVKGLDYDHVGLIYLKNGVPHLLHASQTKKKVIIDKPLDEYVKSVSKFKGISVVRPILSKD